MFGMLPLFLTIRRLGTIRDMINLTECLSYTTIILTFSCSTCDYLKLIIIFACIWLTAGGYVMQKINFRYEFFAHKIRISLTLVLVLMSSTLCLLETDSKEFVALSRVTQLTILLALLVRDHLHFENRLIFSIISHGLIGNSLFFLGYFLILVRPDFSTNIINIITLLLNTGAPPSFAMMREITLFITTHLGFIPTYLRSYDHSFNMKQSHNFTIKLS
ncbi:NADH-ubiquinone oxidoreductase chain 4 [Trichuris trichiura]|uniref:NADH:ubiquinone reductase (H(+)-translocating) n=1 Tax=Trichuris trichiura TaxID=36087 RepID=A0A077ZIG2_TRITR|nr:NADH-ubiquinone oxidoreductase chain 4 [Trichuris trichiura]